MEKIKLLEIITKLELGGAQLSTLELIKGLDKNIYEIYLVSSKSGILVNDIASISGIKFYRLSSLRRELNILYDVKAIFDIYRLIRKQKIDIVHTHSSKAGIVGRWAARLASVRVIIHTVHGWEFHDYQNKAIKYLFILLEKMTAVITHKIIAVSNHDINKGLKFGIGRRNKYQLIRYGIDKEKFNYSFNGNFRKRLGIDDSYFVVGLISCFKPQKNILDFIVSADKVVKHIPVVKFILVGDGQMRNKIVKLIEQLNLSDRFILLGWQRNIPEIISSFDVLALTSLWEGLPFVFLEAMASKKPIVATDIDGNSEVIKDGVNGFLVKPRDKIAFAESIIHLFKHNNLAKQMGENGKAILNGNFELKHMINCIDSLYLHCLKQ